MLCRWVADNAHDPIVNSEFGDGATRNAALDEIRVGRPDFVISNEDAQRIDGDAAVGNHDHNSVPHLLLDVDESGDQALSGHA